MTQQERATQRLPIKEELLRETMNMLVDILKEKGHPNPVSVICNYLVSGDPAYLPPEMRGSVLVKWDNHEITVILAREYLKDYFDNKK
jgi:uncharacterized protein (UPF0297 family)